MFLFQSPVGGSDQPLGEQEFHSILHTGDFRFVSLIAVCISNRLDTCARVLISCVRIMECSSALCPSWTHGTEGDLRKVQPPSPGCSQHTGAGLH